MGLFGGLPLLGLLLVSSSVAQQTGGGQQNGGGPPGGGPPGTTLIPPPNQGMRGPRRIVMRFGLTLGITGKYKVTSQQAWQGIELARTKINNNRERHHIRDGLAWGLLVDMVDDESESKNVQREYARMANDSTYTALMGPYSSTLSSVAIEAFRKAGAKKVLMMHQASTPSVYQTNTSNVYSVNIMATDYLLGGLELLQKRGARTVVLAQGSDKFHKALCDGARNHSQNLGLQVLDTVSINDKDISMGIRKAARLDPDVFVACGHLHNAVQVTVTSKALMYNPKAMLIVQATGHDYKVRVFPRNALHIMGPVLWHPTIAHDCWLFGSSEQFYNEYVAMWNMQPTYHAAQAAAAVIGLFAAITGAWDNPEDPTPPSPQGVRDIITHHTLKTIFGEINISSATGTRSGGKGYVQQFMPVEGSNVTRFDKYSRLDAQLLLDANKVVYPASSWEQKELKIYPCDLGYVLNPEETLCEPCPKGTYRNRGSVVCRPCPIGTYGLTTGLQECNSCHEGMDCVGIRTLGRLVSTPGYYFVADANTTDTQFIDCDPPSLCLEHNRCDREQRGIFCSQCKRGYTNIGPWAAGTLECRKCPNFVLNICGFIAMCLYVGFVYKTVLFSHQLSCGSLTSLHTVILRIFFNYTTLLTAWIRAAGDLKEYAGFRLLLGLFLDPISNFVSLDCGMGATGSQPFLILIVLGLFLIPILLVGTFVAIFIKDMIPLVFTSPMVEPELTDDIEDGGGGKRVGLTESRPDGVDSEDGEEEGEKPESGTLGDSQAEGTLQSSADDARDSRQSGRRDSEPPRPALRRDSEISVGPKSTMAKIVMAQDSEVAPDDLDGDVVQGKVRLHDLQPAKSTVPPGVKPHFDLSREQMDQVLEHVKKRFIRRGVLWIFLSYPVVINMLLAGAICVQKDRPRLAADLEMVCQSTEHIQWFRLCVFGLMMYGIGVPCLIFFQLFRIRHRLLDLTVRQNFGFLYNGFEPNFYYFEAVYMGRKLLVLVALVIPHKTLRFLCMVGAGLIFMGIHIRCEPFDDRDFFVLDRLETMSLTAFLFSCLTGLWFAYMDEMPDNVPEFTEIIRSDTFDWLITCMTILLHAGFLLLCVWSLMRNVFLKHFRFMEECFPEHLSGLQRCLLRLVEKQWHHLKMDPDTHELDVSKLSMDEKRFLYSALNHTVAAYLSAAIRPEAHVENKGKDAPPVDHHKFYVGHMVAALRRAYKRVEYSRYHRAVEYLKEMEKAEQAGPGKPSCWKRMKALMKVAARAGDLAPDGRSLRSSIRNNLRNTKLGKAMEWFQAPTRESLLHLQTQTPGAHSAEKRAAASIRKLGVTVEELHLALMLSWTDIAEGHEEYFVLETEEDRERAFEMEVMRAKGTTWKPDESVKKLFKSLELRRHLAKTKDGDKPVEKRASVAATPQSEDVMSEDQPDVEELLGAPATKEQRDTKNLREKKAELLVEVLELQAQARKLERRLRQAEADGEIPSYSEGNDILSEIPEETNSRENTRMSRQTSHGGNDEVCGPSGGSVAPNFDSTDQSSAFPDSRPGTRFSTLDMADRGATRYSTTASLFPVAHAATNGTAVTDSSRGSRTNSRSDASDSGRTGSKGRASAGDPSRSSSKGTPAVAFASNPDVRGLSPKKGQTGGGLGFGEDLSRADPSRPSKDNVSLGVREVIEEESTPAPTPATPMPPTPMPVESSPSGSSAPSAETPVDGSGSPADKVLSV